MGSAIAFGFLAGGLSEFTRRVGGRLFPPKAKVIGVANNPLPKRGRRDECALSYDDEREKWFVPVFGFAEVDRGISLDGCRSLYASTYVHGQVSKASNSASSNSPQSSGSPPGSAIGQPGS